MQRPYAYARTDTDNDTEVADRHLLRYPDRRNEDALAAVRLAVRSALAADPVLAREMHSMLAGAPGAIQQVRARRDAHSAGRDVIIHQHGAGMSPGPETRRS
jgi:hypothetical protein